VARALQGGFDGLALRHAARKLREISHLAAVFGIEDEINEKVALSAHADMVPARPVDL
jgi:hypothetical protein